MSPSPQQLPPKLPTCFDRPDADIVIYDGQCAFCLAQVRRLAWLDCQHRLAFLSLYDDDVQRRWPELRREDLLRQMYVITTDGRQFGGIGALRYLSRRLRRLWPLMPLLHLPGSLPLWSALYAWIARNRYRILGEVPCDTHCEIPTKKS